MMSIICLFLYYRPRLWRTIYPLTITSKPSLFLTDVPLRKIKRSNSNHLVVQEQFEFNYLTFTILWSLGCREKCLNMAKWLSVQMYQRNATVLLLSSKETPITIYLNHSLFRLKDFVIWALSLSVCQCQSYILAQTESPAISLNRWAHLSSVQWPGYDGEHQG